MPRGRPKLPPEERKSKMISVVMTECEYGNLQSAAEMLEMKVPEIVRVAVGQYIDKRIRDRARRKNG